MECLELKIVNNQAFQYLPRVLSVMLLLTLIIVSGDVDARSGNREKTVGVLYYRLMFGHLHSRPTPYSESLTTIACGQPMRLYERKNSPKMSNQSRDWARVKVGTRQGYVLQKTLAPTKPNCFQDQYPAFFKSFKLDLSELYYWGRLYDQYIRGKSQVF